MASGPKNSTQPTVPMTKYLVFVELSDQTTEDFGKREVKRGPLLSRSSEVPG